MAEEPHGGAQIRPGRTGRGPLVAGVDAKPGDDDIAVPKEQVRGEGAGREGVDPLPIDADVARDLEAVVDQVPPVGGGAGCVRNDTLPGVANVRQGQRRGVRAGTDSPCGGDRGGDPVRAYRPRSSRRCGQGACGGGSDRSSSCARAPGAAAWRGRSNLAVGAGVACTVPGRGCQASVGRGWGGAPGPGHRGWFA